MNSVRVSKGPSADGSRGFSGRRSVSPPAAAGGGGGGSQAAAAVAATASVANEKPQVLWAAIYQESNGAYFPSTLLSKPASYKEARLKALEFLDFLPEHQLTAYRNRRHRGDLWGNTDRAISHDKVHEAFPEFEEPVEEYLGVIATKEKRSEYRDIILFPQTSYMWNNCKHLWAPPRQPPAERDEDDYDDHDYPYDDEDDRDQEDYYERWERHCSCDVRGPFYCECGAAGNGCRDDDY